MATFKPNLSISIPVNKEFMHRTLESDIEYYMIDEKKKLVQLKEKLIDLQETIINACKEPLLNSKKSYISFTESPARDDNIMKTLVYGIRYGDDKWIKIYKTDVAYRTIIESEFIFEVYYQKKAHELNKSCEFISPAVIDYRAFVNEGFVYHYIVMEYIPETKLNKDECDAIKDKVKNVDKCLRKNGIFHNDLATRNVFNRNGKPIIIDFGQALNKERGEHFSLDCDKPHIITPSNVVSLQSSNNDMLPRTNYVPPSPNGGKRKKTNRSKKRKRGSKKRRIYTSKYR
jgi:hypothetical protein